MNQHIYTNLHAHYPDRVVGTAGGIAIIYPLPAACNGMDKTCIYIWFGFDSDRGTIGCSMENAGFNDWRHCFLRHSFRPFSAILHDLEFHLFVQGGGKMRVY